MPLTKVFGISAAGFSSGEDDIENYNAMIESSIRQKLKYEVLKVVKVRCQLKFGFIPKDLRVSFKPLRILSAEQEENVKTQKFNRVLSAASSGQISAIEFREACNKDALLPIQLDTAGLSLDDMSLNEPEVDEEGDEKKPDVKRPPAPKSKIKAPEAKT
jgi:hypothetical protein